MKKTILLSFLFSLFIGGLFAQSIELIHNNEAIANDHEISLLVEPQDMKNLETFVRVKNISGESVSIMMKKHNLSIIDEIDEMLYCWGFSCYNGDNFFPSDVVQLESQQIDSSFHGDYYNNGKQGTSRARFTFFTERNPNDSISVIINYTVGYLGIDKNATAGVSISNVYPNPATTASFIDYKLPKSVMSATLRVSNLLGVVVTEIPLERNEGKATINVSNLKEGIYFYSLIVNNSPTHTRKFVVKR